MEKALIAKTRHLKAMTDRLCELMGWEPGASHKFEIIRQVCSGKAAALSIEKGNQIADKIEESIRKIQELSRRIEELELRNEWGL